MLIIILTTIKFRVKKVAPKTNKKPTKLTLSKVTMIKIIKKTILLTLLLFIPILQFYPTLIEDRTLQEELPGYLDYVQRVRYRLIPWVY